MVFQSTVKPRLSGHVRSQENFRIYEVSVFMKHDLFALVVYVEHVYVTCICYKQLLIKILKSCYVVFNSLCYVVFNLL